MRTLKQLGKGQTSTEKAELEFESTSAGIALSHREGGRKGKGREEGRKEEHC